MPSYSPTINPQEEKIDDGIVWTYISTLSNYVAVIFQYIQSPQKPKGFVKYGDKDVLNKSTSPMAYPCFIADGYHHGKQAPPLPDDPANRDLPGGWDYNGKPITMATVIDDPYCVYDHRLLNLAQKRALIIARARKRPRLSVNIPGIGTFLQNVVLVELNSHSVIGDLIIDSEINWLDDFLGELKSKN